MSFQDDIADDLSELLLDTEEWAETVQLVAHTGAQPVDLRGLWSGDSYGKTKGIGTGAQRVDAEARLLIAAADWPAPSRRARVIRRGDRYRIAHIEPMGSHSHLLHLERFEGGGVASPMRKDGSRL